MHRLINLQSYSHGKVRHPQTQGLIERANSTVKRKVIQKCQDAGYTQPGQQFDWATVILPKIIREENDAPIAMYKNVSAFMAMHGVPRMGGGVVYPCPEALDSLYQSMADCQLAKAFKLHQFPVMEDLQIGTIVNVLATKKQLKDGKAISAWSAKGVIHKVCPMSKDAFAVRWLSLGLSARLTRNGTHMPLDVGTISPYYTRQHLKCVSNAAPASVMVTEHGTVLIAHKFRDDNTCNYVYLDGEWSGKQYNDGIDKFAGLDTIFYADYVRGGGGLDAEGLAEYIKADKELEQRKKQAMKDPGGEAYNHEKVQAVEAWLRSDDPTLRSSVPEFVKLRQKNEKKKKRKGKGKSKKVVGQNGKKVVKPKSAKTKTKVKKQKVEEHKDSVKKVQLIPSLFVRHNTCGTQMSLFVIFYCHNTCGTQTLSQTRSSLLYNPGRGTEA